MPTVTTIYDVIDDIRSRYKTNSEQGAAFERLIQKYLRTDPLYMRFEEIWLWQEWPERKGKPDTGIDLVARDVDGTVCAIQCKFYDEHYYLQKEDIDSFFTASGKTPFSERLIISTTDRWSKHAEDSLADQQIPVARIGLADLATSAVDWSGYRIERPEGMKLMPKKQLRPYQRAALLDVFSGFEEVDRGKLIMACGTGKTFTALKIAEETARRKGGEDTARILFLVPSISLLNQTLREWTVEQTLATHSFGVCSDTKVGKAGANEDIRPHDLPFPATTEAKTLVKQAGEAEGVVEMIVVYSTYQSIGTVAEAQQRGLGDFDLIICDEAHRTTGVTLVGEDESAFVRVHDPDFLRGRKRLYMTATPRLFDEGTKAKAQEQDALLCSMDDEAVYGPELHRLGFGKAVEAGLLTDYKVLVLNVDQGHIAESFQSQLADDNNELNLDDMAKIVGCWNGLAKRGGTLIAGDGFGSNPSPMRRAVAFSRSIKDSKALTAKFESLIDSYTEGQPDALRCEVRHVDGTYNALQRNEELAWLKGELEPGTCRILSNARCLSEGVDVPELDAVLFLNPRNSVVDVVQAVGRVMRRARDKEYGYIILPVGIPSDMDPATALRDNKRYKVVWQVLQALRAHDDRFNAMVNQIELNKRDPKQIDVIGVPGYQGDGGGGANGQAATAQVLFPIADWRDAIYARVVVKVGERAYWEQWADDIRLIAERHVARIRAAIAEPDTPKAEAFQRFVTELRANLNPSVTPADGVDMLAQHLITKPVFDALFGSYAFSEHNPVSQTMQAMLDELDDQALDKEAATLESFYNSVRVRAEGIDNHEGRQAVITELYERFFKKALPKTADAFGIVYTPIPIVDFILRATNQALKDHFDSNLSAAGVQVLDPFTGTGTFIVRLLQSGLIEPKDLLRKYTSELHANEILLLAYYIAAINIEATFHQLYPGEYLPFQGIVLTDTFQLAEDTASLEAKLFPENNKRAARQKAQDIRVIIGNPPYSAGQTSQNDGNRNRSYPILDRRIMEAYVAGSTAGLSRSMYDSYIRAIRWASDRINGQGIVCFVSNGGWIDSHSADGLRKALAREFDAIYVYNLRGNTRAAGEELRREGGKIFGSASRNTVAITLLIRTGATTDSSSVQYHDIGDYLSREDKLELVASASLKSLEWTTIRPNAAGDWLNQRDDTFTRYMPIGDKPRKGQEKSTTLFGLFSYGVVTNRDAWCWNFSGSEVARNTERLVGGYNDQVRAFDEYCAQRGITNRSGAVDEFIDRDPTRISWTRGLKEELSRGRTIEHDAGRIVTGSYRPFCKQALYFDRSLNEIVSQQPRIFPGMLPNLGFHLTGAASHYEFSVIMTDLVPDMHLLDTGQFFPRYSYAEQSGKLGGLFGADPSSETRTDNITDAALEEYRSTFGPAVTQDAIFFYVYGLLHSPEYRSRFATDLNLMLPRIPRVRDFEAFSEAGRQLAQLHVGYEALEPYPLGDPSLEQLVEPGDDIYRVQKMTFGKGPAGAKNRSTIVFNRHITLTGVPEAAYRYMLGPKSAIEWVMDRYQVTSNKASGIVNDPNNWCTQVGDPRYILDLVKRIVTLSLDTMTIVDGLPDLDIID